MDKQKKSTVSCEDCIHYRACSAWNVGVSLSRTAQRCINYERLRDSAVYYIASKETAEKFATKLENRLDSVDIIIHEDNGDNYLSFNEVVELIDEICKELTEGRDGK